MRKGFVVIEIVIVLAIVGILSATWYSAYVEFGKSTISINKEDWACARKEDRTHLQPILSGKATTLIPMTTEECVEYVKRDSGG